MMTAQKKAKLIWNCRRGMLELDLIFQRFLTQDLDKLTDSQIESLEELLSAQDPDLYAWFMGYEAPPNQALGDMIAFIQLHDNAR